VSGVVVAAVPVRAAEPAVLREGEEELVTFAPEPPQPTSGAQPASRAHTARHRMRFMA
jgi:hypothetical protein